MFGAICANRPVQTNLQAISPTQFVFVIAPFPAFAHIVVFLLPGQSLPAGTAAGVYIRFPPALLAARKRRLRLRQKQQQQQQQQQQRQLLLLQQKNAATATATGSGILGEVVDEDGDLADVTDDNNNNNNNNIDVDAREEAVVGGEAEAEGNDAGFQFLGAIANDKPSAIFRVRIHDTADDDAWNGGGSGDAGGGFGGGGGGGGGGSGGGGGMGPDDGMQTDDGDAMLDDYQTTIPAAAAAAAAQEPITLGIAIDSIEAISAQLTALRSSASVTTTTNNTAAAAAAAQQQQQPPPLFSSSSSSSAPPSASGALLPASAYSAAAAGPTRRPAPLPSAQVQLQLARKIITHAFNYLASFSVLVNTANPTSPTITTNTSSGAATAAGTQQAEEDGAGAAQGRQHQEEVIPLRAFHDWWNRFQSRLERDPTFLTREGD